jgi:hypothetical protein
VDSIFAAIAAFFRWLTGRQDLANDPEIKKNKIAQEEQFFTNDTDRLIHVSMYDLDPAKRKAALEELQRMGGA